MDNYELLTVEEAAEFLRMPKETLYHLRKQGRAPRAIKLPRRLLFTKADLIEWAEGHREQSEEAAVPA